MQITGFHQALCVTLMILASFCMFLCVTTVRKLTRQKYAEAINVATGKKEMVKLQDVIWLTMLQNSDWLSEANMDQIPA